MARRSLQKGSVQLHNDQWTVRYWLYDQHGKKIRKRDIIEGVSKRSLKKEAIEAARPIMDRVNKQNNRPSRKVSAGTFQDFVNGPWSSYIARRQSEQRLKPSTIYVYNSMIKNYLIPTLGNRLMPDLGPEDMSRLFDPLYASLEPKYIDNLYSLLRKMFQVAKDYGWIKRKPLRKSLHKPAYTSREKPTLPIDQIKAVVLEVGMEYRLLFVVLFSTMTRIGECVAFRWLNFDERERLLSVTNGLWRGEIGTPKTAASVRAFRLTPALTQALMKHKSHSPFNAPGDFIFCRSDGRPYDPDHLREVVLYPAMDRAGIEREHRRHGFHIFRHTAGSLMHSKTGNTKMVQKALGHARESTTSDIYVHIDPQVVANAVELVTEDLGLVDVLEFTDEMVALAEGDAVPASPTIQ